MRIASSLEIAEIDKALLYHAAYMNMIALIYLH